MAGGFSHNIHMQQSKAAVLAIRFNLHTKTQKKQQKKPTHLMTPMYESVQVESEFLQILFFWAAVSIIKLNAMH